MTKISIYFPVIFILFSQEAKAANETFTTGAFIINMGITPQTVANGLKPYGLIYDLIKNNDVPIKWVIGQAKVKDGVDFIYNGVSYRGGTFVICSEYRNAAVNAKIAAWQAKGVVGATTTTPMTLDVTLTLSAAPNWAMDAQNGAIAIKFLVNAEIPATAYNFRTPATLTACDNLYVMPHADPKWSTHSNLYYWNKNNRGAIWGGCHAVSVMEGPACVNPLNPSESLKFLSTKGLVDHGAHANGSPPYNYLNVTDPAFQMMGSEDAAHTWGSEQIYLPLKTISTWNPSVKISCYDPTQADIPGKSDGPAAVTLYGYAFNDTTRGVVMYQGGHDFSGTTAPEVSAQREFFNWSFLGASHKEPRVTYSNIPATMTGGVLYNNATATAFSPVGSTPFTYQWSSTIGGTFSSSITSVTNYTPPVVGVPTTTKIICKITDGCGRYVVDAYSALIIPPPTAPVAVNDTIKYTGLCSATTQTINVLTNDYDINGNMVNAITFVGGGNYGTFTNNGNGSVTYTPGWLFQGSDTMRYQVCDNTPLCSQGTIVVKTNYSGPCSINQYQVSGTAIGDSIQFNLGVVNPNEALGAPNASNGSNSFTAKFASNNDSLIIRLDTIVNTGDTVQVRLAPDNNNCIDFTIMGSFTAGGFVPGVNSVNLQVPASTAKTYAWYNLILTGPTRYVKIKLRVTGCDTKIDLDAIKANYRYCTTNVPVANKDNIVTAANVFVTTNVRTNDTDPQGGTLSISIVSNPGHGTASVNGAGNITYVPDSAFSGKDTLIYKACNAQCLCDTAMLIIDVQTHPPCGSGVASYFTSGNATSVVGSLSVSNPNNALGIPDASNGTNALSADISSGPGDYIVVDLTDTVYAGDTIVIRIAPDNNNNHPIRVQGNLTNAWGSPTTSTDFNLPGGSAKIFSDYNFILTSDARYIRVIQINGGGHVDVDAFSFSYWHCDAIPNRPPSAVDDTITTYVNRPVFKDVKANDSDPEGDPLTLSIIGPAAAHGTAALSGGGIVYTPNFGYTGSDTVTYKICDNGSPALCDTALFIIVAILPGPPVAMVDNKTVTSGSFVDMNVQANDTLSVNGYIYTTSLMPGILPPSNGTQSLIGNNIRYTPNAGFTGTDSLVYQICDDGSPVQCDTAIVYITVDNQSPVANADAATTPSCNSVIINVVGNDTDPENGVLTITSVSVPSNGTAVISNNEIVYTPSSSPVFTGVANFTYTVCDNGYPSQCAVGNVSVTVNTTSIPSNPPTAANDIDSTYINQSLFVSVLANDSDPDADSIRVDSMATGLLAPTKGTIQYLPNNQIIYVPNYNVTGVDSFDYKVCDIHSSGAGCVNILSSCSVARVRITISNRRPAANDDNAYTINTVAISNSVATNDVEPDGQPMTFSLITGPSSGTFLLNPDGTFTYTPNGVYVGYVYITYLVCDNAPTSLCDTAVLTIYVDITNVPPNPQPDTITTNGIAPYSGNVSTNDMDPNGNINPNGYTFAGGGNNGTLVFNANGTFTYTADTAFIGTDYVTYQVCDLGTPPLCAFATLTIIVPNLPPVTYNENVSVNEDGSLVVPAGSGILSNGDYDPNGTSLTVNTTPVTAPAHGGVTVLANGSFTYTPVANYYGTDFFVVNVCDDSITEPSICSPDTIFITVNPVNDPPIIDNETISTNEDTSVGGDLTDAGDSDPDGTALTANTFPVVAPSNGSIVVNANGTFTYTPNLNFNGTDLVVVSICDAGTPLPSICVNDTIFLTVNAVNDPPVLDNETISTNEDTPVSGDLTDAGDSDPESTALTANTVPVVAPSNGSIVVNANGTYTYTPNVNFNGTDFAVVSICDAGIPLPAQCKNDTIFITVNAVNDQPVLDNETISTNEDIPVSGDLTDAGDFDPDTTALTADTIPVLSPNHGTITINPNGTFTYTPGLNYNGDDTVIVSICDAGLPLPKLCVNDTMVITVLPANDAPVIVNDVNNTFEDTPSSGTIITTDYDPDSLALVVDTIPVSGPFNGTITMDTLGNYNYTPNPDFNGTEVIIFSVCDGNVPLPACVNDTLTITVTAVNDTAIINNDITNTNEDIPVSSTILTAGDFDPDTTALIVDTIPLTGPNHGIFTIDSTGTYTYTPDPDFNGTDTVVVSICDGGTPLPVICVSDTLVITVNAVNDPPIINSDTITINEDNPGSGTIITAGDFDPDSTTLVVDTVPLTGPNHGTFVIDSTGTYTYTPDPDFNGTDTIVVSVCDGGTPLPPSCVNDTLVITVNAVNDPPVITNDSISVNEDNPGSGIIITAGDFDPDTTALIVDTIPLTGPNHGTFTIDSTGIYTYTPDPDFNGTDTIVLNICDGGTPLPVICVSDTLVITVNAVNDPPIINSDTITINEDNPGSGTIITAGDFDPDSTTLVVDTVPLTGPNHGTFVIDSTGTYTYTPDPNFNGTDTIVVSVCDGGTPLPPSCVNDTLTITVVAINDPPVITNDSTTTNEDNPFTGTIITGGDYDPDTTTLVVDTIPLTGPDHGTFTIDSTGTFTYTPDPGFNGSDTIVIVICDSGSPLPAICVNDTLIINITSVNDAPVAINENASVCSGDSVTIAALLNDSDPDMDSLYISSIVPPANGTATTDGITINYIPNPGYHGQDTIIYTVCDSITPQLCSNASVFISVNGPVSSGILANEVLCYGDSTGSVTTAAFFTGTFTYLWNTGAVTPNIVNVPAGLYSVVISDSLGCSITDTATVDQPLAALSVSDSVNNVLCYGDSTGSVILAVSGGTANYNYLWSNGDVTKDLIQAHGNSYTVTVTDNNGCTQTLSVSVAQPAAPLTINALTNPADCLNGISGSIDVTIAGGTGGYSYAWSSGQTTEDVTVSGGTYTIVVMDSNSCTNASTYTITDNSALSIATSDAISFCEGDSAKLSSSIPAGPYQWMSNGVSIPGATDSIYVAYQNATYMLSITNSCGTFTSNAINVAVSPNPVLTFTGSTEICDGSVTQLNASGATTYSWTPSTGLDDDSINNPIASPAITTDYTVTGTTAGCSSDTILQVVVHPLPLANITSTPFECETGSQLNATGGVTYSWSPGFGLDSVNIATPLAHPEASITYVVTVTDSFSCSSTASLYIFVKCDDLLIPNGISPDEDGINDAFEIQGLEKFKQNSLKIFNRWGNLVYQSHPYKNDWKGTCEEKNVISGDRLPDGTYYYILDLGNGKGVKKGFIEIRR